MSGKFPAGQEGRLIARNAKVQTFIAWKQSEAAAPDKAVGRAKDAAKGVMAIGAPERRSVRKTVWGRINQASPTNPIAPSSEAHGSA
jgi:hypothetical protein